MDSKPAPTEAPAAGGMHASSFGAPAPKRKSGLLSRFNQCFQDALESSRGADALASAPAPPDELVLRRAKPPASNRVAIPEGTRVTGSICGEGDAVIGGCVEGDVQVGGRLHLLPSAHVLGNVSSLSCRNEGVIEGQTQCAEDVELAATAQCKGSVSAGTRAAVSGRVSGNVISGGLVYLTASSRVDGDIRAVRLIMEDGAAFNGTCKMRGEIQR